MKRKTIFSRVFSLLVIVLILYLIIGAIGLIGFIMNKSKSSSLYDDNIQGISNISNISNSCSTMSIYYHKAALAVYENDKSALDSALKEITNIQNTIKASQAEYEKSIFSDEERTYYNKFKEQYQVYLNFIDTLSKDCQNAFTTNNTNAVKDDLATGTTVRNNLNTALDAVVNYNSTAANSNNSATQNLCNGLITAQIVLLCISIPLMFILATNVLVNVERELKTVAAKLIVSAESVETAATQLNEASELLATGSSRNAAAIEQTSATMNESASMISQNAENTRHAAQLAHSSNENAMKGKDKMGEMVRSMEELKESSDTIGKIIKTIDDIAFQTNLLAINATVEAARAGGEAGRSFTVVADEVRTLAQRSAKAAADTEAIIERNINLTNSSREVSHEVALTLEEITTEFENLNKIIDEINAASEEQASGIKQINQAISQMEKTTQENAAVAEENAATANSMKDEIAALNEAIGLQKSIIRDPESINDIINKGSNIISSSSSASKTPFKPAPQNKPAVKSPVKPASASNTGKPVSSSESSVLKAPVKPASQPTEAEKIIPLDEDDDF